MKSAFRLSVGVAMLFFCQTLSAEGLIQKTAKDGSWVKYQWTMSDDRSRTTTGGTLKVSLLGTTVIDDSQCRWLETKLELENQQETHQLVMKLCVKEKGFEANENPYQNLQRIWFKLDDGAVTNQLAPLDAPGWLHSCQAAVHHVFDPLGAAERLDDKVVAYQRGRFACRGSKQTKIEEPVKVLIGGVNFEQKTAITRAIWLHDEIPFGVSQCECTEQILRSGKHIKERNVVFTVIDFGDNARSELPDAN